jgi:hypothetical protein
LFLAEHRNRRGIVRDHRASNAITEARYLQGMVAIQKAADVPHLEWRGRLTNADHGSAASRTTGLVDRPGDRDIEAGIDRS